MSENESVTKLLSISAETSGPPELWFEGDEVWGYDYTAGKKRRIGTIIRADKEYRFTAIPFDADTP